MAIIIGILVGFAARFLIPGPRTLVGFAQTMILGVTGAFAAVFAVLFYLAFTVRGQFITTNYGLAPKPAPDPSVYVLLMSGFAGALAVLIIFGLIMQSASKRKANGT